MATIARRDCPGCGLILIDMKAEQKRRDKNQLEIMARELIEILENIVEHNAMTAVQRGNITIIVRKARAAWGWPRG